MICELCGSEVVKKKGLTPKQMHTLNIIDDWIKEHGHSPSYTELCKLMNTNRSNVHGYIKRLKERGYVTNIPGQQRSLQVIN